MKKVLVASAVILMGASMISCKKDYTCTIDILGTESVVEYNDLKKDEADAAQTACELATGTWAAK
jgi:hypothetical protein